MSVYTRSIASAKRMITKYGKPATLTREVSGGFIPGAGSTKTPESQNITIIVLPASGSKIQNLDYQVDLTTLEYDRLAFGIMIGQDLSFQPKPNHMVNIDGEDWTVMGVTPLNPNSGDPIINEVALRI